MVGRAQKTANFRLVICNGKAYVEKYSKAFQSRDTFTLWGILQLLRRYPGKLPDLDLMFNCGDMPVIISKVYSGPNATAPPPLFRYCGSDASVDVIFPDWSFWGWPEINIKPWESLMKDLKESNKRTRWVKREPHAYWKGNPGVAATRKDLMKCNVSKKRDWGARVYAQQVIVGLDTLEMIKEMELSGPSEIDFGIDEIEGEDSDFDNEDDDDDDDDDDADEDYEKDWVAIMEDDEDEDSDQSIGDWAKLETMRSSHPMYFAKKLAEVAAGDPIDWMDQPPAGIAIQGLLRPAFIEEHSVIRKHIFEDHSCNVADVNGVGNIIDGEDHRKINGHDHEPGSSKDSLISAEDLEKDDSLRNGTSFYKLEMINIQLLSEHGQQTIVDVEDFRRAHPDAIAHSAAKIISRLKAGGEKTAQALKSLCWRCKGIQVEEATLIGIDTLGFDLRVCSGTQVQTLRFAYNTRANSEYSAERQLNDLLFPRIHHKVQKMKPANQKEC